MLLTGPASLPREVNRLDRAGGVQDCQLSLCLANHFHFELDHLIIVLVLEGQGIAMHFRVEGNVLSEGSVSGLTGHHKRRCLVGCTSHWQFSCMYRRCVLPMPAWENRLKKEVARSRKRAALHDLGTRTDHRASTASPRAITGVHERTAGSELLYCGSPTVQLLLRSRSSATRPSCLGTVEFLHAHSSNQYNTGLDHGRVWHRRTGRHILLRAQLYGRRHTSRGLFVEPNV